MAAKIKKQKSTKSESQKENLDLKIIKTVWRLWATKIENKINRPTNKIDADIHKEFIKKNKLTLKIQQWLRSDKHNVFTEDINEIALSSNDDKRIQSIDLIET